MDYRSLSSVEQFFIAGHGIFVAVGCSPPGEHASAAELAKEEEEGR